MTSRRRTRSERAQTPAIPNIALPAMAQYPRNSTPINTNILDSDNVYQEQEEEEESFHESETRGSEHPSHMEEHHDENEEDKDDDDTIDRFLIREGKRTAAQAMAENWRMPLELSDQEFEEARKAKAQEQEQRILRERKEEIKRLQYLDQMRKRNKELKEERDREQGMIETRRILETNRKEQEEEYNKLAKEQREMEKQLADLRKDKHSKKPKDYGEPDDPEDPEDPDNPFNGQHQGKKPNDRPLFETSVKFPAPAKFNGTQPRVDNWLIEVDRFVKIHNMSEHHSILYTAMLLTGNAQTWWNSLEMKQESPSTWTTMQQEIYKYFRPVNEERLASDKIYNLKQYKGVQDYISQFNDLTVKIPDIATPEAFRLFMRGLKPEIRNEMEKRRITEGLTRLQQEAHAYDNLLYSQQSNHFN
jgi:hypothetical protein